MRTKFGSNVMDGGDDDNDDEEENTIDATGNTLRSRGRGFMYRFKKTFKKSAKLYMPFWVSPVFSALTDQAKEPLNLMLLFSAAISIALGNTNDATSIAIALLIVSLVAAVQEYRSEQALDKLAHLVPHTTTVLRDGRVLDGLPGDELVVGDLLLLATGDRVPADCRVVDSVELRIDESSLTGENHPVSKYAEGTRNVVLPPSTTSTLSSGGPSTRTNSTVPLEQQQNILFAGTLVNAGRGRALVIAVGGRTEFGKVAKELSTVTSRKSPLQIKIDELGKKLALLSSFAIVLIAVWGVYMGRPLLETLTVAVSLAVAAIPEGLPICTTVTLALGVLRMSKRNAIVKKLPVVESLGCVTVICSDKTGTLTKNEMTARAAFCLAFPQTRFGFSGVGYSSSTGRLMIMKGGTTTTSTSGVESAPTSATSQSLHETSDEFIALSALFSTACLCNNATVMSDIDSSMAEGHAGGPISGQPTELALLIGAAKAMVNDPRPQYHRIQEVPFSSERKRMEVRARPVSGSHCCEAFSLASAGIAYHRQSVDSSMYFVKGMPESILSECSSYPGADGALVALKEDHKSSVLIQSRRMAANGLRVLAMAYGVSLDQLTFAGIIGMEDPPRQGVAESVAQLRQGGVRVAMVTGDSKETALAIARRCGIVGATEMGDVVSPATDMAKIISRPLLSNAVSADSLDTFGESGASSESLDEVGYDLQDIELGASVSLSGADLDNIPPHSLAESIVGVKVFYRVAPRQKLLIVRAAQAHGDIVAMTGDGVNDATALKGADIGIAMGRMGTGACEELKSANKILPCFELTKSRSFTLS